MRTFTTNEEDDFQSNFKLYTERARLEHVNLVKLWGIKYT